MMTSGNCDVGSCCLVKAFSESRGRESALHHYLKAVCSISDMCPMEIKEEAADGLELQPCQHTNQISRPATEDASSSFHATAFTRSHLKGYPLIVGDAKFKLSRDVQLFICDKFVLSKIEVCLNIVANNIGTAEPYLHMWNDHSSFVWHLFDNGESSSQGSQHRCSKRWFLIPDMCVTLLHYYVKHHLNLEVGLATCLTSSFCDTSNNLPRQIQMSVVVEDPAELQILCHSSPSMGPLTDKAASYAIQVRICAGSSSLKGLPLSILQHQPLGSHNTPLLREHDEGSRPARAASSPINIAADCSVEVSEQLWKRSDLHHEDLKVGADMHCRAFMQEEVVTDNEEYSNHHVTRLQEHRGRRKQTAVNCMPLVQCPKCGLAYRGSKDRLQRLLNHALRCHKKKKQEIVGHIINKYFPLVLCWIAEGDCPMRCTCLPVSVQRLPFGKSSPTDLII